jgi:hypothetical protein
MITLLSFVLFFFLAVLGFDLGLTLGRQTLYHLSHIPSLFFSQFSDKVLSFCSG